MIIFSYFLLIKWLQTTGTCNFVALIVKIMLLELALSFSLTFADKTQWFIHLSFSSILQLINNISRDFRKLLRYFKDPAIAVFFKTPFALSASVFPNNSVLYLKHLKLLVYSILALTWVASSLESTNYLL